MALSLFPCLVILLLTAVNALYVAAEFAVVAVQKSQIAPLSASGDQRATRLLAMLEDGAQLDRSVAACQIGITLTSLVAGAYGQASIARALVPWLERTLGLDGSSAQTAAFTLVLLSLTVLQVVLGELVPKSLALQFPERVALATCAPLRCSIALYRGFIWLLNGSGALLLRPFGIAPGGHQHVHSPEELGVLFAASRRAGALHPEAYRRLERGLQLTARTVRQMMTPRSELYAVELSMPPGELLERILQSPYSRLPVYRGSLDHIVGAVTAKTVLGHLASNAKLPPIEQLMRPIPFVPDSLRSHRLVRFLQRERSSKAIVVDEHGSVQGIITINDVLRVLFGEISDELKQPEAGAQTLPDGRVRLPGSMRLDEAAAWLTSRWDGTAMTVGGHIIDTLRRLPVEGESLEIQGVRVTIAEMSSTAVRWIVVQPSPAGQQLANAASRAEGTR